MSKLRGSQKTQCFSYICVFIFQAELSKNLFSLAEIGQIFKKEKTYGQKHIVLVLLFIKYDEKNLRERKRIKTEKKERKKERKKKRKKEKKKESNERIHPVIERAPKT